MAQHNVGQVFEAKIGPEDLPLRAFATIDEPFQVLIGNQRGGHIAPDRGDGSGGTKERDAKGFAHGRVIFAAWPRHLRAVSNRPLAPAPAWWQTAAEMPCGP